MKKILSLGIALLLLAGCSNSPTDNQPIIPPIVTPPIEEPPEEVEEFRSVFNGELIEEGQLYQPFAVIIENSSAARPHSGLSEADVVYEVAVDGWQITRFLAIFNSSIPNKIGPIRSGRIPIVDLAKQWIVPLAHFGAARTGAGDAYSIIRNTRWPIRFDGVSGLNDQYFFRDSARRSPHNAYFKGKDALAKISEMEVNEHFAFDDASNISGSAISEISLRYSSQLTNSYVYEASKNRYLRFINGKPMTDLNSGKQIEVRNVITLTARHWDAEKVRYVLVDFKVGGKAEFFIDGKHEVGIWKQVNGILRFYKANGDDIVLGVGNTWVQVVHTDVKIETKE